ncbi:hypothetical protein [Methylomonas rhizoryzae]|nr:hypothetical protein [Methylomonas rhizoryzae]
MKNLIAWLALLASAPLLAEGDHHDTRHRAGKTGYGELCRFLFTGSAARI